MPSRPEPNRASDAGSGVEVGGGAVVENVSEPSPVAVEVNAWVKVPAGFNVPVFPANVSNEKNGNGEMKYLEPSAVGVTLRIAL